MTGRIAELTNAFGQARKTSRKNKLATKLPPGVTHPKVGPGQLLRVETEIYGLVSGPSWLRASLTVDLLAAGCVKNQYNKCLFTLLDVDDFIEGRNEIHRETVKGFYDKYRSGKAIDLRLAGQEGTRFAGRRVVQHPDIRITVSMDEYVKPKLRPIEVPRGYLSNTKEISDGMLTNVKGVNGGLGWLASTGRPDMAAPHSITPSLYDRRSPQLISEVNASETMSCSSHHHHDLAHSFCGATLDDIHGLKFRHWRATADPTRLVGVCHKKVFQPRTVGAGECATLAKWKAHTKSWESTVGRNLCSKLSRWR